MPKRQRSNLLSLAVLALLHERPMHPYEIASIMRQRGLSNSIRLNTGSLYSCVESLKQRGMIRELETVKVGNHPERTIYAPTEQGREEFFDWLCTLLRKPEKEYTHLAAGLAFIAHLRPDDAASLLKERAEALQKQVDEMKGSVREVLDQGVDRLFLIEEEYAIQLLEAELEWIRRLIRQIEDGTLTRLSDGHRTWKITMEPEQD
ncbi:PadR family transcriptional regulator [Staphylospora marina]|uniref:PadR family transcriptional regulator n=1 Tax=Staphylospora marina TaxID=2490858 RepID=UPI0013DE32A9|nr:PadR family transcriptional regulator [Staphylospora marina]